MMKIPSLTLRGKPVVKMPALGYGTWKLKGDACVASVRKALELGYRHIDTAQIYGNGAEVGTAVRDSGVKRKDIFLTTKVWTTQFQPADLRASVEESLEKLQTDYVDLLLLHWPNPHVDLTKTIKALSSVRGIGKARAIGVSNFTTDLMQEVRHVLSSLQGGAYLACNQVEYHLLLNQAPVLDYARKHEIAVTAYSPLAEGRLRDHPLCTEIGQAHGKSAAQVALRWLIDQGVAAIPKAASEANMRANIDIFDFEFTDAERIALTALNERSHQRQIDPDFAPIWDKPD